MKAYKIEILAIDFDELGKELTIEEIENANFPNDCVSLKILNTKEYDIGEWNEDDSHPLNKKTTNVEEYLKTCPEIK